jgi:hypothetical protein
VPFLSDEDRRKIFELNARKVYPRIAKLIEPAASAAEAV